MQKILTGVSAFLLTLFLPWAAQAQTVTNFTPTQDTWVESQNPTSTANWDQNWLDSEEFISTPITELSYIQFDVSTLPPGDVVSNAILRVWIIRENGADINDLWEVYPVLTPWTDMTLDYNAAVNLNRGTLAASMIPPDIGDPTTNLVTPSQFVDFDLTALVQAWHTLATANEGIEMRIRVGDQADMRVRSMDDASNPTEQPLLIVTHAPPASPPPPAGPPNPKENDNGDGCSCSTIGTLNPGRIGLVLFGSLGLLFFVTRRR